MDYRTYSGLFSYSSTSEFWEKEAVTTTAHYSLSTLTIAIGPTGELRPEKPCPGDGVVPANTGFQIDHSMAHCTRCDDTGKVYDPAALIADALWERCEEKRQEEIHQSGNFMKVTPCIGISCDTCDGFGYVPRAHAEGALRLLKAFPQLGLQVSLEWDSNAWECNIWNPGQVQAIASESADNWPDALAAAVEAKLREGKP